MKSKWMVLTIVLMVLVTFTFAFAGPGRVLIDGEGLKFRDANGNEQVWVPATTITPGTITITSGGGTPVTTTGTETLTNKTLTSPAITTPTITQGTEAQMYVVTPLGVMNAVSLSGDVGITEKGVVTVNKIENVDVDFATVTDGYLQIATDAGSGSWDAKEMTGKIGITNNGVTSIITDLDGDDIAANAIGVSELNINTISVGVATGQTTGTALVVTGSTILSIYAFANIDDEVANIVAISSQTLTVTLNAAGTGASTVFKVVVLEP